MSGGFRTLVLQAVLEHNCCSIKAGQESLGLQTAQKIQSQKFIYTGYSADLCWGLLCAVLCSSGFCWDSWGEFMCPPLGGQSSVWSWCISASCATFDRFLCIWVGIISWLFLFSLNIFNLKISWLSYIFLNCCILKYKNIPKPQIGANVLNFTEIKLDVIFPLLIRLDIEIHVYLVQDIAVP